MRTKFGLVFVFTMFLPPLVFANALVLDDLADLRKLSKADDALDVAQGLAKVDNIADLKKLDDVENVTDLRFLNNSDEAGRIRIREIKDKYGIVFQDGKGKIVLPDDVDAILRKELGNSQVELRFYDDVRDFYTWI